MRFSLGQTSRSCPGDDTEGAEKIAACWADNRSVPRIAFKPDWTRHKNAAPFKRNDTMLDILPIGVIAFPGSGISANLAHKARRMGFPVWRFGAAPGAQFAEHPLSPHSRYHAPMCGRFTNHLTWREIVELYDLTRLDNAPNLRPRSDIRPTDDILILRPRGAGPRAGLS